MEKVNEKVNEKGKGGRMVKKQDIMNEIEKGDKKNFRQIMELVDGWEQELKDSVLERYFDRLENELNEALERQNYFESRFKNKQQSQEDL